MLAGAYRRAVASEADRAKFVSRLRSSGAMAEAPISTRTAPRVFGIPSRLSPAFSATRTPPRASVLARTATVAFLGAPVNSESSPKTSPGPSTRTVSRTTSSRSTPILDEVSPFRLRNPSANFASGGVSRESEKEESPASLSTKTSSVPRTTANMVSPSSPCFTTAEPGGCVTSLAASWSITSKRMRSTPSNTEAPVSAASAKRVGAPNARRARVAPPVPDKTSGRNASCLSPRRIQDSTDATALTYDHPVRFFFLSRISFSSSFSKSSPG
mmetsp:Transcript_8768/g.36757  ORF Transcript_8768/g.36757 Transcript_8768/m.36757 type:complete len:271 (+) Transcript_8768:1053-1865(+)